MFRLFYPQTLLLLITLFSLLFPLTVNAEDTSTENTNATSPGTKKDNKIRDSKLFFDEVFDDYKQELSIAKENGKQGILIMYEMENCPFCARMKATVLNQPEVQDFYHKNFRIFSVDINGDLEITDFKGKSTTQKDFSLKNRVRATPVFQFYNLKGEPLKNGRLTGATKNKDEFLLLGQYIVTKKNEELPFTRFKRHQKTTTTTPQE